MVERRGSSIRLLARSGPNVLLNPTSHVKMANSVHVEKKNRSSPILEIRKLFQKAHDVRTIYDLNTSKSFPGCKNVREEVRSKT